MTESKNEIDLGIQRLVWNDWAASRRIQREFDVVRIRVVDALTARMVEAFGFDPLGKSVKANPLKLADGYSVQVKFFRLEIVNKAEVLTGLGSITAEIVDEEGTMAIDVSADMPQKTLGALTLAGQRALIRGALEQNLVPGVSVAALPTEVTRNGLMTQKCKGAVATEVTGADQVSADLVTEVLAVVDRFSGLFSVFNEYLSKRAAALEVETAPAVAEPLGPPPID